MPDLSTVALLALWGTLAGLDLVTFPQGLLGRPVVAGGVAGLLAGDPAAGLQVGILLELYALDVLPIGAARYPDYGPGAVVAAAGVAALGPWALGPATVLGLALAQLAGQAMEWLRRSSGARVRHLASRLDAGDPSLVRSLQRRGLLLDAGRSLAVTLLGLSVAPALFGLMREAAPALTVLAVGGGMAAAAHGVTQRAGAAAARRWASVGLAIGLVVAWLR